MPIRLLHLADVHLGASFSAFGELAAARRERHLEAFGELPALAEREEVDAVLIAGDLFDGPRPSAAVAAGAREVIRSLVQSGRPVFVVPGNHDSTTLTPNPYREPLGGAHVFGEAGFQRPVSVSTPEGPLHVYGIAYDRARCPEPLAGFTRVEEAGAHVVLLHGSVPDSPHWGTSPNSLRLHPEELRALGADYIALGDYHRFRPPSEFDPAGRIPACYAGSFAAVNLKESGPRGCVVAEIGPEHPPTVRHVASPLAQVEDLGEVDVTGHSGPDEVVEEIARRSAPGSIPVARLVGAPEFPLDRDRLLAELVARYGHAALADESRYYDSSRLEELATRDTVVGHVVRIGAERIRAAGDEGERRIAERALRLALGALEVS